VSFVLLFFIFLFFEQDLALKYLICMFSFVIFVIFVLRTHYHHILQLLLGCGSAALCIFAIFVRCFAFSLPLVAALLPHIIPSYP